MDEGLEIAIDTARGKGAWDDVARLVPKLPSSGHGGDAHDPTSGAIAASTTTTPGTADATPTTTPSTAATTTTTTIAGTGTANAAPSLSSPSNSVDTRGCTRSHPTPATVQAYAATVRGELALKRRGNAAEARRWLWRALEHSPDYPDALCILAELETQLPPGHHDRNSRSNPVAALSQQLRRTMRKTKPKQAGDHKADTASTTSAPAPAPPQPPSPTSDGAASSFVDAAGVAPPHDSSAQPRLTREASGASTKSMDNADGGSDSGGEPTTTTGEPSETPSALRMLPRLLSLSGVDPAMLSQHRLYWLVKGLWLLSDDHSRNQRWASALAASQALWNLLVAYAKHRASGTGAAASPSMYSPHLPGGAGITPMSPSAHQEVDTTRDTLSRVPPQVLGIVIETLTLLPGLLLRCERWKEAVLAYRRCLVTSVRDRLSFIKRRQLLAGLARVMTRVLPEGEYPEWGISDIWQQRRGNSRFTYPPTAGLQTSPVSDAPFLGGSREEAITAACVGLSMPVQSPDASTKSAKSTTSSVAAPGAFNHVDAMRNDLVIHDVRLGRLHRVVKRLEDAVLEQPRSSLHWTQLALALSRLAPTPANATACMSAIEHTLQLRSEQAAAATVTAAAAADEGRTTTTATLSAERRLVPDHVLLMLAARVQREWVGDYDKAVRYAELAVREVSQRSAIAAAPAARRERTRAAEELAVCLTAAATYARGESDVTRKVQHRRATQAALSALRHSTPVHHHHHHHNHHAPGHAQRQRQPHGHHNGHHHNGHQHNNHNPRQLRHSASLPASHLTLPSSTGWVSDDDSSAAGAHSTSTNTRPPLSGRGRHHSFSSAGSGTSGGGGRERSMSAVGLPTARTTTASAHDSREAYSDADADERRRHPDDEIDMAAVAAAAAVRGGGGRGGGGRSSGITNRRRGSGSIASQSAGWGFDDEVLYDSPSGSTPLVVGSSEEGSPAAGLSQVDVLAQHMADGVRSASRQASGANGAHPAPLHEGEAGEPLSHATVRAASNTGHWRVLYHSAMTLAYVGKMWDALDMARRAVVLQPALPAAWALLAAITSCTKGRTQTSHIVEAALRLHPQHVSLLLVEAQLQREAEPLAAVAAYLQVATTLGITCVPQGGLEATAPSQAEVGSNIVPDVSPVLKHLSASLWGSGNHAWNAGDGEADMWTADWDDFSATTAADAASMRTPASTAATAAAMAAGSLGGAAAGAAGAGAGASPATTAAAAAAAAGIAASESPRLLSMGLSSSADLNAIDDKLGSYADARRVGVPAAEWRLLMHLWTALAQACLASGRPADAFACLRNADAVADHAQRPEARADSIHLAGLLHEAEGDITGAEAQYSAALAVDPYHGPSLVRLGALALRAATTRVTAAAAAATAAGGAAGAGVGAGDVTSGLAAAIAANGHTLGTAASDSFTAAAFHDGMHPAGGDVSDQGGFSDFVPDAFSRSERKRGVGAAAGADSDGTLAAKATAAALASDREAAEQADRAEAFVMRCLRLDASDCHAWQSLGGVAALRGDAQGAASAFLTALEVEAGKPILPLKMIPLLL